MGESIPPFSFLQFFTWEFYLPVPFLCLFMVMLGTISGRTDAFVYLMRDEWVALAGSVFALGDRSCLAGSVHDI